jgi:hypothetical protein
MTKAQVALLTGGGVEILRSTGTVVVAEFGDENGKHAGKVPWPTPPLLSRIDWAPSSEASLLVFISQQFVNSEYAKSDLSPPCAASCPDIRD